MIGARISYKIRVLADKAVHGVGPVYLRDLISLYVPGRSLRSADSLELAGYRTMTNTEDSGFSVAAADLWNGLPTTIMGIHNEDGFNAAFFFLTSTIALTPSLFGLLIYWTFIDSLV